MIPNEYLSNVSFKTTSSDYVINFLWHGSELTFKLDDLVIKLWELLSQAFSEFHELVS